jgi:tetrahydromethanopterin S-methyltransferase subunit B
MPKSVQTNFLENICNLKSSENLLLPLIPGVVVLFIGSQFTVIKLLECLEHNLIRSLSPRSHSLESYLHRIQIG